MMKKRKKKKMKRVEKKTRKKRIEKKSFIFMKLLKLKKKSNRRKRRKDKKTLQNIIITIILTTIIVGSIGSFFFELTTISGFSMISTLRDRDVLLTQKTRNFKRFDLAVFSNQNDHVHVRRIIGLPGEKVSYKEDILYINDQPVDEKFLVDEVNESRRNGKNYTDNFMIPIIPDGYYLVLGDNRPYATDSRIYGLISEKNIIGKVKIRVLPFTDVYEF